MINWKRSIVLGVGLGALLTGGERLHREYKDCQGEVVYDGMIGDSHVKYVEGKKAFLSSDTCGYAEMTITKNSEEFFFRNPQDFGGIDFFKASFGDQEREYTRSDMEDKFEGPSVKQLFGRANSMYFDFLKEIRKKNSLEFDRIKKERDAQGYLADKLLR